MDLERRMRRDLMDAMKARDTATVGLLRTMLGAIGNAEAVEIGGHDAAPVVGRHADVPRRHLTDDDRRELVRSEIESMRQAAEEMRSVDRSDRACSLEDGARILARYLTEA
jgi:uncharacterized protein